VSVALFWGATPLAACGDDAASEPSGAAAATSGGTGGGGGSADATSTGEGGAGGDGGAGAGGCLDASAHAAWFTIADPALCAVAVYDADALLGTDADAGFYFRAPTWGRHGGPLTATPKDEGAVEITRWQVPTAATGSLTAATELVANVVPEGGFLGSQAIDLPFFGWTALSWTGQFPATQGELALTGGAAVEARYPVNGLFAGAGLASMGGGHGRVVYAGLSALEDAASSENGLYAADSCGSEGDDPRLLPDGDGSCAAPTLVAAWGDASGPVAADAQGNLFAVLASFGGDQEARGFSAAAIARGAAPTEGDTLFVVPGFGTSLAALAPLEGDDGWLLFQPASSSTFEALDVVAQRYAASDEGIEAEGQPATLLALTTPNTSLALLTDDDGRLWVGAPREGGGSAFVVIARKP
jgi:hypothetical protein